MFKFPENFQILYKIIRIYCVESKIIKSDCALEFSQSQNKACSICFENVITKQPPSEQMFGLMANCKHVFCLHCIRQWRSKRNNFDETIIKSCPICRLESELVIPSEHWVEDNEEKRNILIKYQETHDVDEEVGESLPAPDVEAQIGDLIEIHRTNYQEWVVYVGDGYVIQVYNEDRLSKDIWKSRREKLTVVAKRDLCRVNNLVTASRNFCLKPITTNEVMIQVFSNVDKTLQLPYDKLAQNSLYYVTKCKFGTCFVPPSKFKRSVEHMNL